MEYIDFCDRSLSRIVLGTASFGHTVDRQTAFDIMDCYVENGGNVLDTARLYAGGESERIVGDYIRERGIRDKIFVSTKCSHPVPTDMHTSRLTPPEIEEDTDASLEALGIDAIDILWLHRDDERKGVRHMIDALNELIRKGKILSFGASNWTYERIDSANRYAYESERDGFCASQIHYNMACCNGKWDDTMVLMDEDERKCYSENNFPVFAYSAQARGFFEKYDRGLLSDIARKRYLNEESVKTYAAIKAEAEREGDSISYTALRLLWEMNTFDVFPVIGATSVKQLKDTMNIK